MKQMVLVLGLVFGAGAALTVCSSAYAQYDANGYGNGGYQQGYQGENNYGQGYHQYHPRTYHSYHPYGYNYHPQHYHQQYYNSDQY